MTLRTSNFNNKIKLRISLIFIGPNTRRLEIVGNLESLEGLGEINFRRDRIIGRLVVGRGIKRIRGARGSNILTHINLARKDQSEGPEEEEKMDGTGPSHYGRQ